MLVNAHYSNDGCRDYLGRVAGIHVENLISTGALFVCLFFALLSSYIFTVCFGLSALPRTRGAGGGDVKQKIVMRRAKILLETCIDRGES